MLNVINFVVMLLFSIVIMFIATVVLLILFDFLTEYLPHIQLKIKKIANGISETWAEIKAMENEVYGDDDK